MPEPTPLTPAAPLDALRAAYSRVRALSLELTAPLEVEDLCVQTMPSVSPPKWHLAHTTWYFETFVLGRFLSDYRPFHAGYDALFNSYYQGVGVPFPRARRGTLSRPTVAEVRRYREEVDRRVHGLLDEREPSDDLRFRIVLGLNHEQQHQELLVTDTKHILGSNPLHPAYRDPGARPRGPEPAPAAPAAPAAWVPFAGGRVALGHEGPGFAFDNERPRHEVLLRPFALAERLVTNAEYAAFVDDGGYRRPELWLADGWEAVQAERWEAPLYWRTLDEQRAEYTLWGLAPLERAAPVCHVSYFEADAFARWAGKRLPTEAEWEHAATETLGPGDRAGGERANLLDTGALHPRAAQPSESRPLRQLRGDVWEWTQSPYVPYPGYRPFPGELGEYNGKFMCSQLVLRGGSCATPADHLRLTYRNFFYPQERWQLTGIRLAADA